MKKEIPQPVISIVAEYVSKNESHATLSSLFRYADAPPDEPQGSKLVKASEWLMQTNKLSKSPLAILGKIIERYMDADLPNEPILDLQKEQIEFIDKINKSFSKYGLNYHLGGIITDGASIPSLSLQEAIRQKDFPTIEMEFTRAIENIYQSPREAVSAASNILESTFKIYIADEGLVLPAKQDLQSVWKVVRESLGLNTKLVEDEDLKKILSGLYSITEGIGTLRTHASSAHGAGRKIYNLKPRHARLAINSAHTLTMFILESWNEKKG
ncbi:abortive infection family protein [Proteus mirabilis]|uniref:abortive infection family protein n=1 Tax=Proteus mirabilis TaxID=584 RepID=UPI0023F728C3|nr:abortive infection family protein [Proteus mirabilis]MDF7418575.1 abortive infection family protein [Proteus mirabilis]